jgi:hypothetical protein
VTTDIQLGLLWNSQIKLSLRNESVWTNLSQWMQTKSGALLIYQEKRTLHRQRKWCFDRLLRVLSGHNFLNSFGRPCILSLYVNTQVNVGSQLFHWITAQKIFQTQSKKLTPTHRDREFSLVINSTPEGYLIGRVAICRFNYGMASKIKKGDQFNEAEWLRIEGYNHFLGPILPTTSECTTIAFLIYNCVQRQHWTT